MELSDPIADMFTRIRNASASRHDIVKIPHSKIKEQLTSVLEKEGYVRNSSIEKEGNFKNIHIELKYDEENKPVIQGIKRISKPSLRVYVNVKEIPLVKGGLGTAILSTSKGITTGRRAIKEKIGGELLGILW